uniref:Lipid-binding serum glycoprotein C-terminal domain-containing protein n=1 Tax=Ditylenchus dipsaci TaxID=166011 RepID=A0A915DSH2_9BILA
MGKSSQPILITIDGMGELEGARTDVQDAINKQALELMDGLICSRITFIVEDRLNGRIDDLVERMRARRQRSTDRATLRKRDTALMNSFNMSLPRLHLVEDPSADESGLVLRSSGEVSLRGRGLHPDHRLALFFNTVQAPVIKFHPTSSGGIKFSLMGRIEVILIDNLNGGAETKVAEMGIDVAAHMKMRLSSTSVRPKISLDSFRLSTLTPGILLKKNWMMLLFCRKKCFKEWSTTSCKTAYQYQFIPCSN